MMTPRGFIAAAIIRHAVSLLLREAKSTSIEEYGAALREKALRRKRRLRFSKPSSERPDKQ